MNDMRSFNIGAILKCMTPICIDVWMLIKYLTCLMEMNPSH